MRPWGLLKNAYFEDAPKMASKLSKIAQKTAQDSPKWVHKGSQNDPQMAQDWFKLPKIAPKTAQDIRAYNAL